MENEKINLLGKPIEIADYNDFKFATFLISILDQYDLNGRLIPKETGEKNLNTLIGCPIVAQMIYDPLTGKPSDFGGHNCFITTDEDGNEMVKFGTIPIGSILEAYIEERNVSGYDTPQSCVMIKTKLWSSRFPSYMKVLDKLWAEDKVSSSWELTVLEAIKTVQGRILKSIVWIGNCLLHQSLPAVPQAGMLEYAEVKKCPDDIDLALALSKDMASKDKISNQEESNLENEHTNPIQSSEDPTPVVQGKASLTVYDLHCKLEKSCSEKIDKWCYASFIFPETHTVWCAYDGAENELDYLMFTYEVDDSDSVIVSEATPVKLTVSVAEINKIISEKDSVISLKDAEIVKKDNTLIKANEEIVGLKSEIATLEPYKVEHEQAEAARIEAKKEEKRNEIKIMLIKSKFFSEKDMESEQIKSLIAETDEVGVKSLISDRFMASLDANVKPETAEKQPTTIPKANISFDGDDFTVTKMLNMREHKN